jgi:apyrase
MTEILQESPNQISLSLKATAGMRMLSSNKQKAILDAVIEYFSDKTQVPFNFDPKTSARIITGEDEGLYGWLSVNILESRLLNQELKTSLVLDLGNASTQITFQTENSQLKKPT